MKNPYNSGTGQYQSIAIETQVETATPHEQISMLLQGARTFIATAQGNIQRNQIKEKGEHIGRAISILDGLKVCIDHGNGGEIASNLDKLYSYIQQALVKASLKNDAELLAHANILLGNIQQAWEAINPDKIH
jgi:flagellar protein FliS